MQMSSFSHSKSSAFWSYVLFAKRLFMQGPGTVLLESINYNIKENLSFDHCVIQRIEIFLQFLGAFRRWGESESRISNLQSFSEFLRIFHACG